MASVAAWQLAYLVARRLGVPAPTVAADVVYHVNQDFYTVRASCGAMRAEREYDATAICNIGENMLEHVASRLAALLEMEPRR